MVSLPTLAGYGAWTWILIWRAGLDGLISRNWRSFWRNRAQRAFWSGRGRVWTLERRGENCREKNSAESAEFFSRQFSPRLSSVHTRPRPLQNARCARFRQKERQFLDMSPSRPARHIKIQVHAPYPARVGNETMGKRRGPAPLGCGDVEGNRAVGGYRKSRATHQ